MLKSLAIAAVLATAGTVAANAAVVYPTSVVSANQNGTPVAPDRSVTANALGATDGAFYSLGFGGAITLDFGRLVGGAGTITEVTYNPRGYLEFARLFTSLDGITFTALSTSFNALAIAGQDLFAATPFRYLKLVDASPYRAGRDGFDLDSVGFAPVPLPAAGLALAAGLAGLATLRRRRS